MVGLWSQCVVDGSAALVAETVHERAVRVVLDAPAKRVTAASLARAHPRERADARLLQTALNGLVCFHLLFYPWAATTAQKLDRFQTFLLSRSLDIPWIEGECQRLYWRRRSLRAHFILKRQGFWSDIWQKQL